MAFRRRARRDLTTEQQLARGPMDLIFLALVVLLTVIGLIMLLSASFAIAMYDSYPGIDTGGNPYYYLIHQGGFALAGVIIMYVISRVDYQYFRLLSVPALIGSVVLLLLIFTPLGRSANGARRWLWLGFTFQPSEIAKVAVIMFFAARLSKRSDELKAPRKWSRRTLTGRIGAALDRIGFLELVPYGLIMLGILFLLYKEPHMSAMILVLVGAASVLLVSGVSLGWFAAAGTLVGAALWFIITQTAYMTKRINVWLDPTVDLQGDGFQPWQSRIAIGSGGLLGKGLGNSIQKYQFLPEMQNDCIFAIICEELGLIGACVIIALFMLLIIRGYWLAIHARDRFGTLLIVGIITLLAAQVFFNIGVVTGVIPTTGISLPFFSYGGTALVIQLAEMGIVLSVSRQIAAPKVE